MNTHLQAPLFFGPVVNTGRDYVPPAVYIGNVAAPQWTCRGHSELLGSKPPGFPQPNRNSKAYEERGQWNQCVIQLPSFVHVTRLEGELQTAAAHAETHGVHVDMVDLCGTLPRLCVSYISQINAWRIQDKRVRTWILRVDISLPWDCRVDERSRSVLVNEQREVDSNF